MKKHIGLSSKLIISVLLLSVLLCVTISLMGYKEFTIVLEAQYNRSAYEIAETARTYIDPDRLEYYLETGECDEEYYRIESMLDDLVVSTDSYIIYVTSLSDDYMTSTYIFDAVHPDTGFSRYPLGYIARDMDPDYTDEVAMMMTTGEQIAVYSYSEASGAHTTAAVPVADSSGRIVAMIGVEKAMTEIDSARFAYVRRVLEITIIAVVVFLFAYILFLRRSVIKPILTITGEAQRFAQDNAEQTKVLEHIRSGDEIGILANVIGKMEKDIVSYIDNITSITAEKERIRAELDVARLIQSSMLPRVFPPFPDHTQFDIYATMTPAREVGGDFYDFFLVDDTHIALVMADVSGKGIPAALFMVIARTMIKNCCQLGESTAKVLESVNTELCENNEAGMFVTVWLGIFDMTTGQLEYANAGHEYPAVCRKGGRFELIEEKANFVLAGMDGARYTPRTMRLEPGDRLFLYTDGVPEATDSSLSLYGNDRMLAALDSTAALSAKDALISIKQDVDDFVAGAEAFDDITMLLFEVRECMDNREKRTKSMKASPVLEELAGLISFAENALSEDGAGDNAINHFKVCIDELFSNIVFYSKASMVSVEYIAAPDAYIIKIKDDGEMYDPTKADAPDTSLSAEDRNIGGLGIHIVRNLMSEMNYEYIDGMNVITLVSNKQDSAKKLF